MGAIRQGLMAVLVGAAAVMLEASPAIAQTQQLKQQMEWCARKGNPTLDLLISSCTALIQSGQWTWKGLWIIYFQRGTAYSAKGQYDRAIQDYDQAIMRNPQDADAFYNRGNAKQRKGDTVGGDADIAKARQLQPGIGQDPPRKLLGEPPRF